MKSIFILIMILISEQGYMTNLPNLVYDTRANCEKGLEEMYGEDMNVLLKVPEDSPFSIVSWSGWCLEFNYPADVKPLIMDMSNTLEKMGVWKRT